MSDMILTRHAITRIAQRAFRSDDLDLIRLIGTQVEGGYVVRECDCQAAVRELEKEFKQQCDRIRRMKGKRLVEREGCVVTAYHATKAKMRRLIRRTPERDLED